MYTVFHIYFQNIQFYFTEFNIVQKLKCANEVGHILTTFWTKSNRYSRTENLRDIFFYSHFKIFILEKFWHSTHGVIHHRVVSLKEDPPPSCHLFLFYFSNIFRGHMSFCGVTN